MGKKAIENDNVNKCRSSDILLEIVKDEYSKAFDRANSLDNKAGFFITVIIAVVTIFIPIIPFDKILSFYSVAGCCQKCMVGVLLVCAFVAFVMLMLAFCRFYDAYKLTEFQHANLENSNEEGNHNADRGQLSKALCENYRLIVENNNKVIDIKCEAISRGIRLSGIGVFLLFIASIGLIIIIGG